MAESKKQQSEMQTALATQKKKLESELQRSQNKGKTNAAKEQELSDEVERLRKLLEQAEDEKQQFEI